MSATRIGFGDPTDPLLMVWFAVDMTGLDALPDWDVPPVLPTRIIPGSNPPKTVTHFTGVEPATVTWKLNLDTRTDLQALRAMLGTEQTLQILANVQSLPGEYIEYEERGYEMLPSTLLASLRRVQVFVETGECECEATFQRTVDPATGEIVP